jgi:antitoxin (DNA-binding transcriptional repressor) of toxin-antitoxin stability system
MEVVNVNEAKTKLSALIKKVLAGEEVIIARNNKPVIELKQYFPKIKMRQLGILNGQMTISGTWEDLDKVVLDSFEQSEIFPDENHSN